jgi:predicted transcriptional regulator
MHTVETAVSLPKETLDGLDELARRTGRSRSSLVAEACEQFLRRRRDATLTDRLNDVWGSLTEQEVQAEVDWLLEPALQMARKANEGDSGWGAGGPDIAE